MSLFYLRPTSFADHLSRSVLTKGQLQALTNLTKAVLGPKTERTAGRARKGPDGLWIGGTAYERDIRARPVRGTRCYTNAYSHQVAPNIVSPAPCLKIGDGPLDRGLKLRQLVNLVCIPPNLQVHPLNKPLVDRTRHCCRHLRADWTSRLR